MKRLFLFPFLILAVFFVISCGGDEEEEVSGDTAADKDSVEATDDSTGLPSENGDSDETSGEEPDQDAGEKEEGELGGPCYPNETCNEGLVCDTEKNICIEEPENSSDSDGDNKPDNDKDDNVQDGDSETVTDADADHGVITEGICTEAGGTWDDAKGSCTKTVKCAAKPVNALWNGDPAYTMTYSDGAWSGEIETKYSEEAGTCRYKCRFVWNGEQCVVPLGRICTGLDKCYHNSGETDCPAEGGDFYGQDAQNTSQCVPQNLEVSGSENERVVIDHNTGLVWPQSPSAETYKWSNAQEACNKLNSGNYAGFNDWRLPDPHEILTIADSGRYSSAVNGVFLNMPRLTSYFWTSKSASSSKFWRFTTNNGNVDNSGTSSQTFKVLCVHGNKLPKGIIGQTGENGWNVVADSTAQLMWHPDKVSKNWQAALAHCQTLNADKYAGHDDWRLPNKNELASLLNFDKTTTPYSDFPNISNSRLWTSSALPGNKNYAHIVYFAEGVSYYSKSQALLVKCVRSVTAPDNVDPCDPNPCEGIDNSTEECVAIGDMSYSCKCEEGYAWRGNRCQKDPCLENSCGDIANSTGKCIATSETTFQCECNQEYSWDGSACINSCSSNPCSSITNSTGSCTATGETTYQCGCKPGYYWKSANNSCVSPCESNPCSSVSNSTKECTVKVIPSTTSSSYYCGCNPGYFWNYSNQCQSQVRTVCTGQNKCYDESAELTCPSSGDFFGQDAQYTSKCTGKSFSTKSATGSETTVFDNRNGLEWQQTIPATGYTWANAKSYCEDLTYGGYSDWRLPTPKELFTIMSSSRTNPAALDTFNAGSSDVFYWTSKQVANSTSEAWLINIRWGYLNKDSKTNSKDSSDYLYKVRCVRGASLKEGSFTTTTVSGNDIVTDSTTGLIWTKTDASNKYWKDALIHCEGLTYAGKSDWRLPNKDELITLVNYDKYQPASDFPGTTSSTYWSSTSRSNSPDYAFDVRIEDGKVSTYPKTQYKRHVKCVRSE